MKTYPGLPEPQVDVVVDYESSRERYQGQAEFYIASLHLCGNTGTYVDAPRHRFHGATDLADLALDRLADLAIAKINRVGADLGHRRFPSVLSEQGVDRELVVHVLIGGANGKLKGDRHLAYPKLNLEETKPTGNLLLSILDRFDIHMDSIGDCTGRLEDL